MKYLIFTLCFLLVCCGAMAQLPISVRSTNGTAINLTVNGGLSVGNPSVNSSPEIVMSVNGGTGVVSTGDAGLILQNNSTNFFQSGTSLFISSMGIDGGGNPVVIDKVAASIAYVPTNRLEELNAGNSILVFNNAVGLKGLGVCSPGIGFDSGNYATEWNEFRPTTFWGVPFFVGGVYQPDGVAWNFTVSGVSVNPTSPAVYKDAGGDIFVVNATSISGGNGNVNTSSRLATPAASGTLTKISGTGDATLTYSAFTTATWLWSVNVNPNNGIFNAFKSEVLTGSLTVNGNIWTATQPGQSNMINGGMLGPNSSVTVSNLTLSTTPPAGVAVAIDISGGGGSGFKMVGNGLGVIFQSQQIASINNNGSTVGNSQFRVEGTGTGNEINPQNDLAWNLGDSTHRFSTNFVNTLVVGAGTNTPSFTLVNTNWVSGQIYTNQTGRPIEVKMPCQITMTGVAGNSTFALVVTGVTTNSLSMSTLITSLATSLTNQVSAWVAAGGTFTGTNLSSGTGDSSGTVNGGQYMVY